jgi:hypothetical protein
VSGDRASNTASTNAAMLTLPLPLLLLLPIAALRNSCRYGWYTTCAGAGGSVGCYLPMSIKMELPLSPLSLLRPWVVLLHSCAVQQPAPKQHKDSCGLSMQG